MIHIDCICSGHSPSFPPPSLPPSLPLSGLTLALGMKIYNMGMQGVAIFLSCLKTCKLHQMDYHMGLTKLLQHQKLCIFVIAIEHIQKPTTNNTSVILISSIYVHVHIYSKLCKSAVRKIVLKSIRVHLGPGSC